MDIINRTISKNFSFQGMSPKLSTQNIEIVVKSYEPARKESFGHDSDNGFSDEKPLITPKLTKLQKLTNWYLENRAPIINKMLTITVHIFIMVIFEIYFYFNYVIYLEKDEFIGKVNKYINQLDQINLNPLQKQIISNFFMANLEQVSANVYAEYVKSLHQQSQLKKILQILAYKMAGVVGAFLFFFFVWGTINWKEINWKGIIIDNMLMFVFLGTFEYLFFSNIVLHYSPVTDGEIKYIMYNGLVDYFNQTTR